jgi:hypothetical protein
MQPGDKEKLDQCLEILDSTDLGMSLVWLWTWSTIKEILDGGEWDQLVSEDEAWDILAKDVARGYEFTLQWGVEDHYEHVQDWMIDKGLISHLDLDGDEEDVLESEQGEE